MLLSYLLLLSAFEPMSRISKRNNVCKTFRDYYYPDENENCYFDPDTTLETPKLIEKYTGNIETHKVTTEDGYILTMFRIPRSNPKGVILLHHSIATSSQIYLWQGNNSLAITLWKNGFDVWLANQRGTTYSDKHINMTSLNFRYWDFSFHEMGVYDVSSELEAIREKTNGSKVIYFGHSLGSATGLVYSAMKPLEAKKYLKSMILLAAPAYFKYSTSLVFLFKDLAYVLKSFLDSVHMGSALIILPILLPISRVFLRMFPIFLFVVNVLILAFCGYTPSETDPTFFNYDGTIYADNFSWKTVIHFLQISDSKRFQMYDYGKEGNWEVYGKSTPPEYPLKKISVPTLLVSSFNDTLITAQDSDDLFEEMSPEVKLDHWKISGLNHLDYHIGLHRKEIFVDRLLEFVHNL